MKKTRLALDLILAWILILWAPALTTGQNSQPIITMQDAATATGNGTSIDTSVSPNALLAAVGVQITGTFSATITFEVSFDRSNWVAVMATNANNDTRATTATAPGAYSILLNGAVLCRARISAYTSGTVTIKGRLTGGLISRTSGGGGGGGGGDALTTNPLSQFASTTSAQLRGVLSDETGSGVAVFADTPTLITPVLGVATATSINKVAITAPASSATITIANGASLITSGANALTLTSTGTTNSTFPVGTDTLAGLGTAQTFTANQTFGSGIARMTSPRVTTGILDANGNSMLAFGPASSSVSNWKFSNAATASKGVLVLEGESSDSAVSLHFKAKAGTYPNSGQVFFNSSVRYNEPAIAFYDLNSSTYNPNVGIGMKAGGSWLSLIAPNIMLGAGDGTSGTVGVTGNSYLAFNVNSTAAEDCPACVATGIYKAAKHVIGFAAAAETPDGTLPNGGTISFTANTPSQITSNQDNYDPGAASYFQRWSTDASRNVTGMTFATSTKVSGQMHRIWNVGSFNIVLVHDATSTAANRFLSSTGANITIAANGCADVQYDTTQSRWLATPCGSAASSGVTSIATTSPITGGTITSTGTIACATCVTSAASLTSNAIVIGGGSQATSTTTTGTGVLTALGVNVGSSGAFVVDGGALGTPSSGTLTNATGLPPTTGISGWPANASGVLTNNGSGTLSWGAAGGGITVGTTTISSGVSGSVPYNNAGVYSETNLTYASSVLTQTQTSLGASRADGLVLTNTTAATSGTTQLSQSLRFSASGYKTTPTAAARTVEVNLDLRPIEQTTNPAYGLQISTQCASCTTGTSFSQHSVFGVAVDGTQYAWFPGGSESGWAGVTLGPNFGTQAAPTINGIYANSGGGWLIIRPANNAGAHGGGFKLLSGGTFGWSDNSSSIPTGTVDTFIGRQAAASIRFGAADLNGTPVAQTLRVQNAITGTDKAAAASFNITGPLGTGNTTPGYISLQGGARNTASGTTANSAVDRLIVGATKVLTNNTNTAIVNVTDASNTTAAGTVDYAIEVFDGTDIQVESGTFTYQVTNKGGTIANNTITAPTGFPKNVTTSGTLTATWTITAANPAVLTLNANSSLTPSTGYPRLTYTIRNLTNQAIAVQ